MSSVPSILVVGSLNSDLILMTEQFPKSGETVVGRESHVANGGKGANQAVAAARLGAEVAMVGKIGDDANGHRMVNDLIKDGIDTSFIEIDSQVASGLAAIIVEKDGSNRIIIFPGANQCIGTDAVDRALEAGYDAVMLQLEIDVEMSVYAARKAIQAGIPVILDAAPAQAFELERMRGLFLVTPNETEAQALTGIQIDTDSDAKKAAEILQKRTDAKYVVIKMGSRGSLLWDGSEARKFDIIPIDVVDTTAAGDSYTAALTYEYLRTKDIVRAMQYANVVATLAVSKLGAQSSLPTKEEVARFISERNIIL